MTRRVALLIAALAIAGVAPPAAGQGSGHGAGQAAGQGAGQDLGRATQRPADTTEVADTTQVGAGEERRDTVRTPDLREQVLQKLRALEAASRPRSERADSTAPPDSTAPADPTAPTDSTARVDTNARADSTAPADSVAMAAAVAGSDSVARAKPPTTGASPDSAVPGELGGSKRSAERASPPPAGVLLASDSVVARLRALQGYTVTEYRAASARYDGVSGQLDLAGSPQLERGSESMRADSLLRYDQRTSIVCGYGKPVLSGTGNDPVESDQVCYDVNRQVGVALGAKTTFSQQGTWYVHGSELYTSGTNRLYGAATSFTTCDIDEPHYHFSAGEMKVVHDQVMVARNVTLKFGDVPVFWLPFLIQSLKPDRRSGLLTPTLGLQHVVRTSSGYRREIRNIGFYWAIGDHFGLTTAMDWQSGGYIALRGDLQYRWLRQFLNGNISFSRFWEFERGTRFALSGTSNWQPGERTSLRASINYASSSDFVRRYSVDPEELNRSIDSNMGLTHRFDWGSLSLTANRRQHLSNDHIDLTFPSVSLNLEPITLFESTDDPRWYNNATWQNSLNFTARSREVNLALPTERGQNTAALQGALSSRLTLGKLSWSGNFNFDESVQHGRPTWYDPAAPDTVVPDSIVFNRAVQQTMKWTTSLGFTQNLIENTTLTPMVSMSGGMRMRTDLPDSLGVHGHVEEPVRLTAGASLRTNIFGFWPGVGPYSRIRHRIEPSFSYSYSPTPTVTDLQRRAFGTGYDGLREINQLSVTVSQTFEAKPKESNDASVEAAEDTVTGAFGEVPPRRSAQVRPISLLRVSSTALLYDFVKAREGEYGLTTDQMTHTIGSDLVPGLSLSVGHDLWKTSAGTDEEVGPRSFSPRLRTVNANFSLSSDSWPFRLFRGGGSGGEDIDAPGAAPVDSMLPDDQDDIGRSVIPGRPNHRQPTYTGNQAVGSWRGDFSYSLTRPQAGIPGEENQFLRVRLSFQPTEKWNVSWNTGYSLTDREFADHVISLNRDLHRWRASFYFSRTQFGAFTFRFNVQLLDNPDIKVDYDQRTLPPPPQFQ